MNKSGQLQMEKAQPRLRKRARGQAPNVEQLIRPGAGVKGAIGNVVRFGNACADQPHVVDEEQPNDSRIRGAQLKTRRL